jgi:hypothetical protein
MRAVGRSLVVRPSGEIPVNARDVVLAFVMCLGAISFGIVDGRAENEDPCAAEKQAVAAAKANVAQKQLEMESELKANYEELLGLLNSVIAPIEAWGQSQVELRQALEALAKCQGGPKVSKLVPPPNGRTWEPQAHLVTSRGSVRRLWDAPPT